MITIVAHSDSSAEKFAKENGLKFEELLTAEQLEAIKLEEECKPIAEEQQLAEEKRIAEEREKARLDELERQRQLEEESRRTAEEQRLAEEKRIAEQRKAEYNVLIAEKKQLLQTIAENKGLFGEKARRRKEAKQKLKEVETKLAAYPEFA